jgi:hypothetical protein
MKLATLVGYTSGVAFIAPSLSDQAMLGTGIAVSICHAIMCRLFARNNGYPRLGWTLLGFAGGIWAVAVLILLPRRAASSPRDHVARGPRPG